MEVLEIVMRTSTSLTVVVVGRDRPDAIHSTLQSLTHQSMDLQKLTVLLAVIDEGPRQVSPVDFTSFELNLEVAYIEELDESSKELGLLKTITGDYITFVTAGDRLSSTFLETLLQEAGETLIPVSQIAEAENDATAVWRTPYNRAVLRHQTSSSRSYSEEGVVMTEVVGKMVPRTRLTEEALVYALTGKGLLFNIHLALTYKFDYSRFPAGLAATYYRTSAELSDTFDKGTDDATELVAAVDKLQGPDFEKISEKQRSFIIAGITWQLQSRDLYLDPAIRAILLRRIADLGLIELSGGVVDETVSTLAVVANFAPYAGTAGIVAAKRIIESGEKVDLISSSLSSRKKQDQDLELTRDRVRVHELVSATPDPTVDEEISEFIDAGLARFERLQIRGARYNNLYSRAMVPHSHFLAAAIKRRNPEIVWVAEFSDPLSLTVKATSRPASFKTSVVSDNFVGWGTFRQQRCLLEETSMPKWAELLAYFFADKLIFTNQHQLETMLEYAPTIYRGFIESKATIARHPTLPARYYKMGTPGWRYDPEVITLAYFGDFHSTRGMGEVVEALARLDSEVLRRFRLVIFTDSESRYIHGTLPEDLSSLVVVRPRLGYLDFLATLNEMSVLIVNDSLTRKYFSVNPYLPSKVSDYMGSGTPIWGIYEAGSVMSQMAFAFKSQLGDVSGAETVLQQIYTMNLAP